MSNYEDVKGLVSEQMKDSAQSLAQTTMTQENNDSFSFDNDLLNQIGLSVQRR